MSTIYDENCSLQLGMVKNCAMEEMHLFLFSHEMGKENVAVHKKCIQGNNDAIFDRLVGDLFGIWLVWGWFGWFLGGLWVV